MSRGTVIRNLGQAQYYVRLEFDRGFEQLLFVTTLAEINALQDKITDFEETRRLALEAKNEALSAIGELESEINELDGILSDLNSLIDSNPNAPSKESISNRTQLVITDPRITVNTTPEELRTIIQEARAAREALRLERREVISLGSLSAEIEADRAKLEAFTVAQQEAEDARKGLDDDINIEVTNLSGKEQQLKATTDPAQRDQIQAEILVLQDALRQLLERAFRFASIAASAKAQSSRLKLAIASSRSRLEGYLRAYEERIKNPIGRIAYCADHTETIPVGTEVGLIEPARQSAREHPNLNTFIIQPGARPNSPGFEHDPARDGEFIDPFFIDDPNTIIYFAAMKPPANVWFPRYRTARLDFIDYDNDTCQITVDPFEEEIAIGTEPSRSFYPANSQVWSQVDIVYMDCNAAPFQLNDWVVVEFTQTKLLGRSKFVPNPASFPPFARTVQFDGEYFTYDPTRYDSFNADEDIAITPTVIGFVEEPRPCVDQPVTMLPTLAFGATGIKHVAAIGVCRAYLMGTAVRAFVQPGDPPFDRSTVHFSRSTNPPWAWEDIQNESFVFTMAVDEDSREIRMRIDFNGLPQIPKINGKFVYRIRVSRWEFGRNSPSRSIDDAFILSDFDRSTPRPINQANANHNQTFDRYEFSYDELLFPADHALYWINLGQRPRILPLLGGPQLSLKRDTPNPVDRGVYSGRYRHAMWVDVRASDAKVVNAATNNSPAILSADSHVNVPIGWVFFGLYRSKITSNVRLYRVIRFQLFVSPPLGTSLKGARSFLSGNVGQPNVGSQVHTFVGPPYTRGPVSWPLPDMNQIIPHVDYNGTMIWCMGQRMKGLHTGTIFTAPTIAPALSRTNDPIYTHGSTRDFIAYAGSNAYSYLKYESVPVQPNTAGTPLSLNAWEQSDLGFVNGELIAIDNN